MYYIDFSSFTVTVAWFASLKKKMKKHLLKKNTKKNKQRKKLIDNEKWLNKKIKKHNRYWSRRTLIYLLYLFTEPLVCAQAPGTS